MARYDEQKEEESKILAWATALHPRLEEIFEKESVASDISEGDLVFRITVRTPLEGRKNARGLLQILVAREALDDYLLDERYGPMATEKFVRLVRGRRKGYVAEPYTMDITEPAVWAVGCEEVRAR